MPLWKHDLPVGGNKWKEHEEMVTHEGKCKNTQKYYPTMLKVCCLKIQTISTNVSLLSQYRYIVFNTFFEKPLSVGARTIVIKLKHQISFAVFSTELRII